MTSDRVNEPIILRKQKSSLKPINGLLKLRLLQEVIGLDENHQPARAEVVGERMGMANSFKPREPTGAERDRALDHISRTPKGGLTVVAFDRGLNACRDSLQALSPEQAFVGGLNVFKRRDVSEPRNVTLVASNGTLLELDKCSLSSDDQYHGVGRGTEFNLFLPESGDTQSLSWAVLNCHEYTHIDILKTLLEHRVELLVVVTMHGASRLYWEFATSDVHRLFCYVAIANIAEVGGSGVFAPFRRVGGQHYAQLSSAGQVFGARGPARFAVEIDLEIGELRMLRKEFQEHGFWADAARGARVGSQQREEDASNRLQRPLIVEPVVPSEHFLHTVDRPAGAPMVNAVRDVPHTFSAGTLRVAIAQLTHMPPSAYINTRYRIRLDPAVGPFTKRLNAHLDELDLRCRAVGPAESGALLDMLVLPEVFVPRSFLPRLQRFCSRLGCIAVAGIDYPGAHEEENANECAILRPHQDAVYYRKITRSQYDAHRDYQGNRMKMARGDSLLRFVDEKGHGFGVLICYDYSHIDVIHRLNQEGRSEPLEFLVVVAHNPFGDLYRSCCIADSHRLYQYIVMCNVADYGGSGVFGPLRTSGARQTLVSVGKGVDAIALAHLDLEGLRAARRASDESLNDTSHANPLRRFMRRPGVFQCRLAGP